MQSSFPPDVVPRSYLYAPGNRRDMLDKAAAGEADAVIADLEDGVAPSAKEEARETVAGWLDGSDVPVPRWVRINNDPARMDADIDAAARAGTAGIYLPKATPSTVARAAGRLSSFAARRNLPAGTVAIIALVETAVGLVGLHEMAAHESVARLAIGEADLAADLGIEPTAPSSVWLPIRMQLVVASAAAGLDPPIGPVSTDFRNDAHTRESTVALRELGFGARATIHPRQAVIVNEVFTPTPEEVGAARELLARFDEARAAGSGVIIAADGTMADAATVRHARLVVARARLAETG